MAGTTQTLCACLYLFLKNLTEEKDQMLHHFTVTFLADTYKNYEPKKEEQNKFIRGANTIDF